MELICSRQNPLVKRFRALANPSADCLLLDGAHLLEEALGSGITVDVVAVRDRNGGAPARALAERAARGGARIVGVTDAVMDAISPVRNPSGVVAIGRRRSTALDAVLENPPQLVLILCDVQDPGNVGGIVRAAEGCGATGIIATEGTADPFGWKALRGSMGSAFRMPIAVRQPLEPALHAARGRKIRLYAAVPRDGVSLPRCDLRAPVAVLLGGEGTGLPADVVGQLDGRLSIPMRPPVESLNVATAAALIAYEAMRQREGTAP